MHRRSFILELDGRVKYRSDINLILVSNGKSEQESVVDDECEYEYDGHAKSASKNLLKNDFRAFLDRSCANDFAFKWLMSPA